MTVDLERSPRTATRADVARVAGTSQAVVSYVVNDGPRRVAPATRDRVLAAIEETGYRPNQVARALARGRSSAVGLIVPDVANPFYAAVASSVERAVADTGAVVLLGHSAGSQEREHALLEAYADQGVDTILMAPSADQVDLGRLRRRPPHVVLLDRGADAPLPRVTVDHQEAARFAVAHLVAHGRQRIGCVSGPEDLAVARLRRRGWRDALDQAGLRPGPHACGPFSRTGGYDAAALVLAQDLDAVFVSTEQQAVGVLRRAAELGIRVPEDLALFTFDGTADAEFTLPALSTMAQPFDEIARTALSLVMSDESPDQVVQLACSAQIRRSCGCPDG
ncbi:MAG: LacI family transcriptional regulator [Propionibacteriaceae bacterium]|nr:LacI family transcriptional regulator [Propionibacteriaceae bacterium]